MSEKYLPAFVMLVAGAITCIFDIYHKTELLPSLKRLFIVLIIFYIIGLIARSIIVKVITYRPRIDETEGEQENKEKDESEELKGTDSNID